MEISADFSSGMYEVEKIINRKISRNKKYYLVKWLCYPIHECTWEPKTSLKDINYMLDSYERQYPYSIDQEMYELYLEEQEKQLKRRNKRRNKPKEIQSELLAIHLCNSEQIANETSRNRTTTISALNPL